VADILMLAGFAVLSNSLLALITGLIGAAWFVLAPFTEEPWLRDQFGEEYDRYIDAVPRFIGR
jgi:protein-S-isoprenylcysteine O-methyltransferase Ste14